MQKSRMQATQSGLGERGGDKESYRYNTFICNLRVLSLLMERVTYGLAELYYKTYTYNIKYGAILTYSCLRHGILKWYYMGTYLSRIRTSIISKANQ